MQSPHRGFDCERTKKANHNIFCNFGIPIEYSSTTSVVPVTQYIVIIATNINTEPNRVYKKNLNAE